MLHQFVTFFIVTLAFYSKKKKKELTEIQYNHQFTVKGMKNAKTII